MADQYEEQRLRRVWGSFLSSLYSEFGYTVLQPKEVDKELKPLLNKAIEKYKELKGSDDGSNEKSS